MPENGSTDAQRGDPKALQRLLAMLCQTGVIKQPQQPVEDNARSRIINKFQREHEIPRHDNTAGKPERRCPIARSRFELI
jgi:hypothetical protein